MKRLNLVDNKNHNSRYDVIDSLFLRLKRDGPVFTSLITYPAFFEWSKFLKYKKPDMWKIIFEWKRRKCIRLVRGHGFEILK